MDHLRYAGKSKSEQQAVLEQIIRDEPVLMYVLHKASALQLPDWWIVSGAIYNNVWNALTGRPSMTGVKDIDVFYFDDHDLSYEAEDAVIQRAAPLFADLPVPVEIRNQARVHLWYADHFGHPCEPIVSSEDSIQRFASKTHAVAVRLDDEDRLIIHAPFGLDDIFSFRVVPNRVMNNNSQAHANKAARARRHWPELTVEAW